MRPITVSVGPLTASSATNVRTASGVLTAGAVVLNGSLVSGGVATFDMPRRVLLTTTADETTKTATLTGTNWSGNPISEVVTLVNNSTVASVLDYKTLSSVVISAALTGNLSVGTNGVAGSAWVMCDPWALPPIGVQVNVSGTVNWTVQITYDDPNSPTNAVAPASVAWLSSLDTNLVSKTATAAGSLANTPAYVRLLLNSQTNPGYASMTVSQPGVVPQ